MIKKILAACIAACIAVISPLHVSKAGLFKEFSIRDEKELAKEFEILVKSRLPIIEDPEIKSYVRSVVDRIIAKVPPQPFDFETNVIYSPVLNAFATPGGYVCVYSGLLVNIEDEDSLAGILSHEVAHVTQRHIASRIDRGTYLFRNLGCYGGSCFSRRGGCLRGFACRFNGDFAGGDAQLWTAG